MKNDELHETACFHEHDDDAWRTDHHASGVHLHGADYPHHDHIDHDLEIIRRLR